jgi:hypothetical protein
LYSTAVPENPSLQWFHPPEWEQLEDARLRKNGRRASSKQAINTTIHPQISPLVPNAISLYHKNPSILQGSVLWGHEQGQNERCRRTPCVPVPKSAETPKNASPGSKRPRASTPKVPSV